MKQPEFDRLRELAARTAGLVALVFHMEPAAMFRETRGDTEESFARLLAMYLMHITFDEGPTNIGVAFGRHHSTVEHAIERISEACEANADFHGEMIRLQTWLAEATELGRGYLMQLAALRQGEAA